MSSRLPILVVLWVALPRLALAGDTMRCGSRIISTEASAAAILAACGEPSYRDVASVPVPAGAGWVADTERWTYNFGSNQLLRVLTLRNGRLTDIASDGYGFAVSARPGCAPNDIFEGQSKYRLLQTCGAPMTQRRIGYLQTLRPHHRQRWGGITREGGGYFPVEVYREEWTYNFGSRYLLRVVTLDDGRVADVQNGERGFNP